MQEMYQNYEEEVDWELPDERDPFTESDNTEVMIGCVEVYLESIGYMVCTYVLPQTCSLSLDF